MVYYQLMVLLSFNLAHKALPSPYQLGKKMINYHKMLRLKSSKIHRSSVGASAETVFDNEDLLIHILLRLPLKSLLKSKSVSKQWRSLISSPRFSQHRRSTSDLIAPSSLLLYRQLKDSRSFDSISLGTNPSTAPFEALDLTTRKIDILQFCNGLFLCSSGSHEFNQEDYYIYNPTTKQFVEIPYPQFEDGRRERWLILGLCLAFDPDRLSSNYQIVCVQYLGHPNYGINIYSSESGRWRRPENHVFEGESFIFNAGVYWERSIHWINNWKNCIYFDLCEDKLQEIAMPRVRDLDHGSSERRIEYFGDCGGHLYLIEMYDLKLDVLEMQQDHSGWFVKYHLDLQSFGDAYPTIIDRIPKIRAVYPKLIHPESKLVIDRIPKLEIDRNSKFWVLALIDRSDQLYEEPYLVVGVHKELVRLNLHSGSFATMMTKDDTIMGAYLFIEGISS